MHPHRWGLVGDALDPGDLAAHLVVGGLAGARFTVGFGDPVELIWEDRPMLPADPQLYYEEVVILEDIPAGTPVTWHVSNHGQNVWSLIDLLVVNP
ncbi:MAG: hypothetical protein QF464_03880 [Myxococcota bacterium]|nr:hypothetical protein [Myxococcota bacterium]